MPPLDSDSSRWFAEHLQVHEPLLRAWLQSRFPGLIEIEDIIQEAYLRVLDARADREIRQPKAFFFATARNLACNHYRKYHLKYTEPLGDADDFPVLDETGDVTATLARNQEIELMTQAIQSLPDRCRQVMTLRMVYSLSYKEIAAQLGIALKTVEVQIATGTRRCIDFVAKHGDPR